MSLGADLRAFRDKTLQRSDELLRAIALEVLRRIVMRSPVGNPELWAANQQTMQGRRDALAEAEKAGKRISRRALEKRLPLKSGKGYVGGRFRGNWQVTFGAPATGALETIDPSGGATIDQAQSILQGAKYGITIFLVNNLPYAHRLEYDSWSKQAPRGMVRITAAEFQGVLSDVMNEMQE